MNVINEIRDVSDKAIDKLAEVWGDLPRPVLAAIGAGDAAMEKLAALRRKEFVQDVERFFSELPGKAQQLVADLPAKAQEAANALKPDHLRDTVDDYRSTVTTTYGNLADRGNEAVARARSAAAEQKAEQGGDAGVTVTEAEVVDLHPTDAADIADGVVVEDSTDGGAPDSE